MDSTGILCNEPCVDQGAFWHANMELYYGYLPGEIVEVVHEAGKYWLAKIQYCYRNLILLKWVGNYGEFWVDTSMTNATMSSCNSSSEFKAPKRLFPLGHHTHPQLKSQFTLEKPGKILEAPSLYNPAKDPYANIMNVDDLLAHEVDEHDIKDDTFVNKSSSDNIDLALVCKNKIQFKQEDVDELEAALQNLNEIAYDEPTTQTESPENPMSIYNSNTIEKNFDEVDASIRPSCQKSDPESVADEHIASQGAVQTKQLSLTSEENELASEVDINNGVRDNDVIAKITDNCETRKASIEIGQDEDLEGANSSLELCKLLQSSAITDGRYRGLNHMCTEQTDKVFYLKPKQFYDMGGANHERLLVPGTLVEVCHSYENEDGSLDISHWFAFIVKNTGGRITLRWFLSDEPKFKQGRLELKSCRSKLVVEESDQPSETGEQIEEGNNINEKVMNSTATSCDGLPAKSITFSMHFCHPRIHTLHYAEKNDRKYMLPRVITDFLTYKMSDNETLMTKIKEDHMNHVFDNRRMNLDKDRPLIDHLFATVSHRAPTYLDLIFAHQDTNSRREVLISCPKMTKLIRATIRRELEPGVFEVHSEPLEENGEIIKFIHPFDSSYAILPIDWSVNNEDCLSVNPTPDRIEKKQISELDDTNCDRSTSDDKSENTTQPSAAALDEEHSGVEDSTITVTKDTEPPHVCLKASRNSIPRVGGPFIKLDESTKKSLIGAEGLSLDFNELDPTCWSRILRSKELKAPLFHCCIDYKDKEIFDSKFKVMDLLEVVHPSSDSTICLGRIRKVVFPLLWIQLSEDCFTLVPFNQTDIYPAKWSSNYDYKLLSLLPPRKRCIDSSTQNTNSKKRKKTKASEELQVDHSNTSSKIATPDCNELYEKEHFDLTDMYYRQIDFDTILQEKANYIKIFFNHKCFTGPSLSKSKICSLPQYVGPGPMHLVLDEVVTKIISVAYVPPRILNDLSSKSFEELLIERQLTNTKKATFKAKYQKRVHRERVPVCLNPKDIAAYCECICEHIKCCYNLFGPNLYDGDDCPSHCRSLTKSNKFMKRATYYREKARQGEYLATDNASNSKKTNSQLASNSKTAQPKPPGRGSSESTNSSIISRSDQIKSRASSSSPSDADTAVNDLKETLKAVLEEVEYEVDQDKAIENSRVIGQADCEMFENVVKREPFETNGLINYENAIDSDNQNRPEFEVLNSKRMITNPEEWTVEEVMQYLDCCQLGMFKSNMEFESIDGQALLLLDNDAIKEHFQSPKKTDFSSKEVAKLCRFVESIKARTLKSFD